MDTDFGELYCFGHVTGGFGRTRLALNCGTHDSRPLIDLEPEFGYRRREQRRGGGRGGGKPTLQSKGSCQSPLGRQSVESIHLIGFTRFHLGFSERFAKLSSHQDKLYRA